MAKSKKPKEPKAPKTDEVAQQGHNRGQYIPDLKERFERIEKIREDKRVLNKAETEEKNQIKKQYGYSKRAVTNELALRALEKTTRTQLEAEAHDLRVATGYQYAMDLKSETLDRTENQFADPGDPEAEANKLAGVARKKAVA